MRVENGRVYGGGIPGGGNDMSTGCRARKAWAVGEQEPAGGWNATSNLTVVGKAGGAGGSLPAAGWGEGL